MALKMAMAQPRRTLDQITDELCNLANRALEYHEALELAGGELTEETTDLHAELVAAEARLEELDMDLHSKVDAYVAVWRTHKDMAEGIARAAENLRLRARAHQATADRIRSGLRSAMDRLGVKRIETYQSVVRIQKSSPSCRPEGEIPPAYQRVKIEFDGRQALADLREAGLLPTEPGTYQINGLTVHVGEHMVIR